LGAFVNNSEFYLIELTEYAGGLEWSNNVLTHFIVKCIESSGVSIFRRIK